MSWLETFRTGLMGLMVHKVRTVLSMLGIIFGIGSVVAMLSIGEGARYDMQQKVAALGIKTVRVVEPTDRKQEETKSVRATSAGLTRAEAEDFRQRIPDLVGVAPVRITKCEVRIGDHAADVVVTATTSEYALVGTDRVAAGRFLLPTDEAEAGRVAVLSHSVADELLGGRDPLDAFVRIEHELYRVVGVLAPRGELAGGKKVKGLEDIQDFGRRVFIPLSAALHRMTRNPLRSELDEVVCGVREVNQIQAVAAAARTFFKEAHGGLEDFRVRVAIDLLAQNERTQEIFDIVMGSIAGISLLVGGIGIMNIMLANISERRREIGIRRAVGARQRDVLYQFLVEAASICSIGGLVGVPVGIGLASVISASADWATRVSLDGIVLSLGVSVIVGVAFGTYPAWKAARMDPIQALSME